MKWATWIGMRIAVKKFSTSLKPKSGIGRFVTQSGTIARYSRKRLNNGKMQLSNEYFQNKKIGLLLKFLNKTPEKGTYQIPHSKNCIFDYVWEIMDTKFGSSEETTFLLKPWYKVTTFWASSLQATNFPRPRLRKCPGRSEIFCF